MILITHDLGVVAEIADDVLVMYAGRQVEHQDVIGLFDAPRHAYTQRLMNARPRPDVEAQADGPAGRRRLPDAPTPTREAA
jgi:ABC-type dipeptide/oligopeptide/nickel transport system ATPase component